MRYFALASLIFLSACQTEEIPTPPPETKKTTLRIGANEDPLTLDPRKARSLNNVTFLKMFYEGLTTQDEKGNTALALAEDVDVSYDKKTFTFTLRDCLWSNGDKITAFDVESSWKSVLKPDFPAPNAYQLFVIKGAKAAKSGQLPLNEVGIKALNENTLVVELEAATPYFLELVGTYPFFPIHPSQVEAESFEVVASGPFVLKEWDKRNELQAMKNPIYWDAESVKLDTIISVFLEDNTALQLFETKELDWVGSPLATLPAHSLATLKDQGKLESCPGAGTQFFCFNVEKPPFDNSKIRKAFSLAIDRQELIDHVMQGNQTPATAFVPNSFGLQLSPYFDDHNLEEAKKLFEEAEIESFPSITLSYVSSERNHKIAQVVQQQWKQVFGIDVAIENCESKIYFDRIANRDFQICVGSWYGDYRDPITFLEIFKSKSNTTNSSQWENSQFTDLLSLSAKAQDPKNRTTILRRAERILMQEMPIAPLYHASFSYLKNEHVNGVYFSDLGYLDFKHASFE